MPAALGLRVQIKRLQVPGGQVAREADARNLLSTRASAKAGLRSPTPT